MANNGQYDSQTNIEQEDYEQEILMQPETATVYGGTVVNSINGQIGDVILTTSDLENTSDYQTGEEVGIAIDNAISGKQDTLTAGNNISISNNVISATDTTYTAGEGLNLSETEFSVDTTVIATLQDVSDEATLRENADTALQGQIDALTVSSDVIDVLGTYQDLQNYDTSHVKDNDIIKVLQDSTHNNAMSYYRWSVNGNVGSWVYVGSEGPYYTKSEADSLLNVKQDIEDNSLNTANKTIVGAINEVDGIAKGANQALSFVNYSTMIAEFNSLDDDVYNVGQNLYIVTVEVPDLWVSSVESTSSTYTYVDDATVINDLETNGYIQVGYYKLSMLETQKVDLTNYVTNTDYAGYSTGGTIMLNSSYGTGISNGYLRGLTKTYADYGNASDYLIISKGTLENVITGKGVILNTNYATASSAGVIKAPSGYGISVGSTGNLFTIIKTYADYGISSDNLFIGKGTLENVINGKGLNISSINSGENVNITNLLPNGYTRLEYIESSGTQYIDPGIASSNTIGININYSYSTINSSTNAGVCGIYQGSNPRTDSLLITTNNGKTNSNLLFAHRGVVLMADHIPTANTIYNVKINWRNSGVIDFEERTTNVGTNNVESGAIRLFGRKAGSSYTYAPSKIYSCQFSDETKMIRNLIPAKRNSDSVIGMYDTVNGVFYENGGTGTFTAGAELDNIPKINFKNEDGYVKNTDYATATVGGVIKTSNSYAVALASGSIVSTPKTYTDYSSMSNYGFIGKGTLENVITGKELDLKQLSTFDSTKTQVLKNINGTLTWVDE